MMDVRTAWALLDEEAMQGAICWPTGYFIIDNVCTKGHLYSVPSSSTRGAGFPLRALFDSATCLMEGSAHSIPSNDPRHEAVYADVEGLEPRYICFHSVGGALAF